MSKTEGMSKTKYAVTLPDGTVATRTSARPYTHAVVVAFPASEDFDKARNTIEVLSEWLPQNEGKTGPNDQWHYDCNIKRLAEAQATLARLEATVDPTGFTYGVVRWSSSAVNAAPEARKPHWNAKGRTAKIVEVDK